MIFDAGACSNSAFSSASSASEYGTACTWVTSNDSDTFLSCSDGALGLAEHLLVGTRLAVIDVEVLVRLRIGEDIEIGERLADRLGPAGPFQPSTEVLAGVPLRCEPADHS